MQYNTVIVTTLIVHFMNLGEQEKVWKREKKDEKKKVFRKEKKTKKKKNNKKQRKRTKI